MSKARDLASASPAPSTVSATELGYLDGVTSAVQTQLNAKQAVVSGVNDTEIGYLDGVTSAIQTQLNAKEATLPSQTGNSGKYLTTDGTNKSWGTIAAGSWTLIAESTPSGVSSVNFTSIPATYKHLMLEWIGIIHSTTDQSFCIRVNNDSGVNYSVQYRGSNGYISRDNTGTQISCSNAQGATTASFGWGATTSNWDQSVSGKAFFYDYYSTTKYKHIDYDSAYTATGISQYGNMGRTIWRSTSAITSIDIVRTSGATATLSTVTNGYIRLWGSN